MDVPRRDGLDPEVLGQMAERGVPPGVAPLVRPLELDEEPLPPERGCEPGGACGVAKREPVARAAGEADEPLVELGDRRERHGGLEQDAVLLPLGSRARMRGGEDPAQVRVAPARLDEQRQVRPARLVAPAPAEPATPLEGGSVVPTPLSVTSAPVIGRTPAIFAAWANSSEP